MTLNAHVTPVCLSPGGTDAFRAAHAPNELLVATVEGAIRLERCSGAQGWEITGRSLTEFHVAALASDPLSGVLFAGTYGGGLFRSRNGGTSWEASGPSEDTRDVTALGLLTSGRETTLYAGTAPTHLYRSHDRGNSWDELRAVAGAAAALSADFGGNQVLHIGCDRSGTRGIYVCLGNGLLLRIEVGGGFQVLGRRCNGARRGEAPHRMLPSPHVGGEILAAAGDRLARSADSGSSWEPLDTSSLGLARIECAHHGPHDQHTLFVAGATTAADEWSVSGEARAIIGRSCDRGRTWNQVRGGLPRRIRGNIEAMSLTTWSGSFGFCIGTTDGDVFVSNDEGETWHLAARSLAPISIRDHYEALEQGQWLMRTVYAAATCFSF